MKRYISLAVALLCFGLFFACARRYAPMPSAEEPPNTTMAETETETERETTEEVIEETEAATESTTMQTSATTTTAAAAKTSAAAVAQHATASTASKINSTASTTARTSATRAPTTTATPPAPTAAPPTTTTTTAKPPSPVYMQADYDAIIKAVKDYAEAKTKVRFIWSPSLSYDGPVSYHDVINLSLYGKEFVINELKYNCDLTETQISGGSGGVPGDAVYYNIVYFEYQGDMMFAHLYA